MTCYQRERRQKLKLGTETGAQVERTKTLGGGGGPHGRGVRYSAIEVEAALLAVVMQGGIVTRAAELTGISPDTLSRWANLEYNQRYSELRAEKGPELEQLAIQGLLEFVHKAESAKALALEKTVQQLVAGEAKDPGATLRNIATAQGISVTKIMELSGRPTSTVIHQSPAELMARLASLGAVVNSTAREEITPATLVETNPSVAPGTGDSTEAGA